MSTSVNSFVAAVAFSNDTESFVVVAFSNDGKSLVVEVLPCSSTFDMIAEGKQHRFTIAIANDNFSSMTFWLC